LQTLKRDVRQFDWPHIVPNVLEIDFHGIIIKKQTANVVVGGAWPAILFFDKAVWKGISSAKNVVENNSISNHRDRIIAVFLCGY
jgi:hypothetical protein